MKIISLTSASTRVDGVAVALDKGAEVDLPDKKAKHLIKVGIAKPAVEPAHAARETKTTAPAETKTTEPKTASTKTAETK